MIKSSYLEFPLEIQSGDKTTRDGTAFWEKRHHRLGIFLNVHWKYHCWYYVLENTILGIFLTSFQHQQQFISSKNHIFFFLMEQRVRQVAGDLHLLYTLHIYMGIGFSRNIDRCLTLSKKDTPLANLEEKVSIQIGKS